MEYAPMKVGKGKASTKSKIGRERETALQDVMSQTGISRKEALALWNKEHKK